MDIQPLETFLAVEKTKNFTAAAQELFCTQAAISMRIKKLETTLGTPLFIRRSRTVELTHDGETFLPYARQIYNTWKSAKEHLLQNRLMEQSEIQIACSSTPGTYLIPSVMYLFRQRHPYITVVNHVQYTKNVIESVESGKVPLGIISQPANVSSQTMVCEPLMDDPLVLVVSPHHPWAGTSGILLRQLVSQTFLISNPNTSLVRYLENVGGFAMDHDKLYVAGNIEAIKRGISSNQGVSVMSAFAVRQELELGLLCSVPVLDRGTLSRKIYLIYRTGYTPSLSVQFFLEFAKEAVTDGSIAKG
ncbi:MAG: LysR family transcriptional regulator [Angelakisella sp.]